MEKIRIIVQLKLKKPSDKYGIIRIRGYYDNRPVTSKSTGIKVHTDHWDANARAVIPAAPNASLVNTVIQKRLQEMQARLLKMDVTGQQVNRNSVYQAVKGLDHSRDFVAFCRERIRIEYTSKETIRTYNSECTKLQQFQALISFADIDYTFLTHYKKYMQVKLGNDDNTIWKTFKFLNTMMRKAIKIGGIIQENPFGQFDRGKYVQSQRDYLDISDCDKIEVIALDENQPVVIRRVAIRFLFMCYSGMRFSDAAAFNPDDHIAKDERIRMNYQKFNTNVNNIMWDRLRRIADLMREFPLKITNQKFNQWLKVLQSLARINTPLKSHLGRHTLGSLLVDAEVSIEQAQVILGHKDIRSTRVYYHQKPKNIDKALGKLNIYINSANL
jgi:integrase/recombinase XerD